MSNSALNLTIAITGASGSIYGFSLLKFFLLNDSRVDFVISCNGEYVTFKEMGLDLRGLNAEEKRDSILKFLALEDKQNFLKVWDQKNIAASIASGSYKQEAMIVAPCSVGSLGNIANSTSNNLITRAADVILKERKKLILLVREMPFNSLHLANMKTLSDCGAVIMTASPAFYQHPKTIQDQIDFIVGKVLDQLDIDNAMFNRWKGESNILKEYLTLN
jgi:4-hydroxy-3-polyprenylbenzoate decarboxylase